MSEPPDEFLSGVFSAIQFMVLDAGNPTYAAQIAKEHGIDRAWALKEVKRTGYEVRKMNKFIREELS